MKNHGSILRQSRDGWQIAAATNGAAEWQSVHDDRKLDATRLAIEVFRFVSIRGLSNNIAITIESKSALVARLTITNPADLRDARLMGYKVEERLPLAAEDFAADYINEGIEVLGVVTPICEWLPLVSALEDEGLQVHSISPTAISAVQSFLATFENPACDLLVWQDGETLELFDLGRRILDWRHLPAEPASLLRQIGATLLRTHGSLKIALLGVEDSLRRALDDLEDVELHVVDALPLPEQARRGATSALIGKTKPWVELRRGALMAGEPHRAVRSDWQRCRWALVLLLLSLATFFWMRHRQYEQQINQLQVRQKELYREVFPGTRVPNAVASRLKSEHTKLIGARGNEAAVVQPASALNVLYEVVSGLPARIRFQTQQILIEDGKIDLDLKLSNFGRASDLTDALEEQGFSVEPPRIEQQDEKSVSVRINGELERERREEGA